MRKISLAIGLTVVLSTHVGFADTQNNVPTPNNKPCATIANACLVAGFVRTENPGKRIWQDCMKPIIMGQTVQGINIDSTTASTCLTYKINKLTNELQELQNASSSQTTPSTNQETTPTPAQTTTPPAPATPPTQTTPPTNPDTTQ